MEVAAQAVGIAGGALEKAIAYAKKRYTFGRPIIEHQGLQWMLAEMATQVEAARSFLYDVALSIRPRGGSSWASDGHG